MEDEGVSDERSVAETMSVRDDDDDDTIADGVSASADPLCSRSQSLFSSASDSNVPQVIRDLRDNGAVFSAAPTSTWYWQNDGMSVRLNKELSVYFSVDTTCTSQEIITGLDAIGVDVDFITAIQRRTSSGSWVVTFNNALAKSKVIGSTNLFISGCQVFAGDCDNRVVIVKVHEAPPEMPDSVVLGHLSHYGKVLSFRRDRVSDGIENGVRTARMRLRASIPSSVLIAGEAIRIWYPGQPKTCRRCGSLGHLANSCTSIRCLNCQHPGHHSRNCSSPRLCSVCLSPDHLCGDCPFVLLSVNITRPPRAFTYADVTKTIAVPPKPPASPPPAGAGSPAPPSETPAPAGGEAAGEPAPVPVQEPVFTDGGNSPSPEVIPETQPGNVPLEESSESAGSWASRSEPRSGSPERGASGRDAPGGSPARARDRERRLEPRAERGNDRERSRTRERPEHLSDSDENDGFTTVKRRR